MYNWVLYFISYWLRGRRNVCALSRWVSAPINGYLFGSGGGARFPPSSSILQYPSNMAKKEEEGGEGEGGGGEGGKKRNRL